MQEKYWFRAREKGIGWYPASWQGWLVMLAYVIAVSSVAVIVEIFSSSLLEMILWLTPLLLVPTIGLIWICYRKGEEPDK